MRILHVTPSFYPAWAYGGMPRCAYELCRSLAQLGEEVSVWTTDAYERARRLDAGHATVAGIRIRRFRNWSNRLAHDWQLYLPAGARAAARHDIDAFDIVHIHSHRHLLESVVGKAAQRQGVPYVFTGNGTVPAMERYVPIKRLLDRLGSRAVLRGAAACIAVSTAEVSHYEAQGVPADRVRVIPNGIRLQEFENLPAAGSFRRAHGLGNAPVVLFVGKITPRKGVDVLVRAFSLLPDDSRLVVAGNFMMPEEPVRRLVDELGLSQRVLFAGLLLGDERNAAYGDADVVAYPSTDEIFGLVVAEALMCHTPVVVCDDSGCGELVRAAGGGLLVPYGDADRLAAALRSLLESRASRDRFAAAGRRFVERHLGWHQIAAQTREVYREIVPALPT